MELIEEADTAALENAIAQLELIDSTSGAQAAAVTQVLNELPPVYREKFKQSLSSGTVLNELSGMQWTPWYMVDFPKVCPAQCSTLYLG